MLMYELTLKLCKRCNELKEYASTTTTAETSSSTGFPANEPASEKIESMFRLKYN